MLRNCVVLSFGMLFVCGAWFGLVVVIFSILICFGNGVWVGVLMFMLWICFWFVFGSLGGYCLLYSAGL